MDNKVWREGQCEFNSGRHEYSFAGKCSLRDGYTTRWFAMMVCRFCLRPKRVYYGDAE